jgi:Rieske Fe-S protein
MSGRRGLPSPAGSRFSEADPWAGRDRTHRLPWVRLPVGSQISSPARQCGVCIMKSEVTNPSTGTPAPAGPPERRTFLSWIAVGLGGVATLAVAVPFVGYLLGPLVRKPKVEWLSLGEVSDFPLGETRPVTRTNKLRQPWDGMAAQMTVFVSNLGQDANGKHKFRIFAANCAHLGCPVSWFPQSKLFMCPCHGGVYYEDGKRASGPPPRGLYECNYEVRDGELMLQAPHLPTLQDPLKKPSRTEGDMTS